MSSAVAVAVVLRQMMVTRQAVVAVVAGRKSSTFHGRRRKPVRLVRVVLAAAQMLDRQVAPVPIHGFVSMVAHLPQQQLHKVF